MAMQCEASRYINDELPEFQIVYTTAHSVIEPFHAGVRTLDRVVWGQVNVWAAFIEEYRALQ